MKQTEIMTTKIMLEWYLEILRGLPESRDLLYDFEAEYSNSFADFLISAAHFSAENHSGEALASIIDDYLEGLTVKVERQRELYLALLSTLDVRLVDILKEYNFEVSGTDDMILAKSGDPRVNRNISIFFNLTNSGYIPIEIRHSRGSIETRDMSVSDFIALLKEKVLVVNM